MPFSRARRSAFCASLLALALWAGPGVTASSQAAQDVRSAVLGVMNASTVAWSAGDLDRFMDSYEDSADTVYVGKEGTVNGRAAIQAMYAKHFGGATPGSLGKLSFDVIDIRALGDRHALMIGRFHLASPEVGKPEASGIFTLVFHERDGHWRIVCDHTA